MAVDTRQSLLTYIWNLLTADSSLTTIMGGTVRCYRTWAPPDAVFPYLVHRLDIRKEPGTHVIQRATHYLDIWSDSSNTEEIDNIRKRLIELLDELIFSTSEVARVHIEFFSGGDIPETEQGIWHFATMWEWIFRRDAEATSIEER